MTPTASNSTVPCVANTNSVFAAGSDTRGGWWSAVRGRSQFVVNVVSNAGGSSLNSILQLLLLLALGRLLENSVYAAYFTACSIIAIGEVASDFGTRLWAVRRFAGSGNARQTFLDCVSNKLLFSLLAIAVLALLPINTLPFSALVLAVMVATTQPSSDPFLWYLRGKERLDIEAGLVLSCRIAIVAALIGAALFDIQLTTLLLAWLACNVIRMLAESRLDICRPLFAATGAKPLGAVGTLSGRVFRSGSREDFRFASSSKLLTSSATPVISPTGLNFGNVWNNVVEVAPIGLSLLLAPMFTQSALLFVTIYGTDTSVTQFGAAFRLVLAAGFVGTSIVVSSFARLSKAIDGDDRQACRKIIRTKFLLLTAALVPICVGGMLLSVPVASLVAELTQKPDLATAGGVMVWLMPGLYLSCVNMGAKFTLNAFGLNRQDVLAMLIGFLTLVVAFQLTSLLSLPIRAALCWTAGELAVLISRLTFLKFQNRLQGVPTALISGALVTLVLLAGSLNSVKDIS